MPTPTKPTLKEVHDRIVALANRPEATLEYINSILPFLRGPRINEVVPRSGYAGGVVEITGANFVPDRADNAVTVSGKPAVVVEASNTRLRVITDKTTTTGPVKVTVGAHTAGGPFGYRVLPYPLPGAEEDGPPIYFAGQGQAAPGDAPSTGVLRVLFSLVNPSDMVPADPAAARNGAVCSDILQFVARVLVIRRQRGWWVPIPISGTTLPVFSWCERAVRS